MPKTTDDIVDAIMRRLGSQPVGEQQVAAVLRAIAVGGIIRRMLSDEATERGREKGAGTWATAQVWGAGEVLFDLIEVLDARAAAQPPREALTADYVDGWNARALAEAQDMSGWQFAMRGPDGKRYFPKIAADIIEGSTVVRSRKATDWEDSPAQDISLLRLREDPMLGGRYTKNGYTYESWLVGHTWEYRILGTTLVVQECSGSGWAEHKATCGTCSWKTWPLQAGAEQMLDDAWNHWMKEGHGGILAGD